MKPEREMKIGLLISGGGTTAEAIIKACQGGRLKPIIPAVVISSRPDAPGIEKAKNLGIETFIVQRKDFSNPKEFGGKLLEILKSFKVDLVSQNGWLAWTPPNVVVEYRGRIINQHPGPLDPGKADFGGKGMYGARVTCARLVYEWLTAEKKPWTESTIHFVNERYDQGELIRVVRMAIAPLSYPITIAYLRKNPKFLVEETKKIQSQLLPLEHENVITALQSLAKGEFFSYQRSRPLISSENKKTLYWSKSLAIQLFPKG